MKKDRAGLVFVVGCGSIARRHIANLKRLGVRRVAACDPDAARLDQARKEFGCVPVHSVATGLALSPDAVLVCTPPSAHASAALAAIEQGIPCFIEKPIADSVKAAETIRRAAVRRGVLVAVGYQLRRHPAIVWIRRGLDERRWGPVQYIRAQVGQYLPDWRPWQDYRKSYTARKALGGGILLDASHEIDLALHLAGPARSVFCAADRLSPLKIDVEDTAELTLRFASGAMGSVHLDMIRRAYDRSCQILCRDGVVEWSYQDGTVRVYDARSAKWKTIPISKDGNVQYLDEMRLFLSSLGRRRAPGLAGLDESLSALRIVEAAKLSARAGRTVSLR